MASTLDEMGVSVININGINFKYFMKLFGNFQNSSGPIYQIYCAGLTDNDPGKDRYPEKNEKVKGKNPIIDDKDEIDQNDWTRLFVSPLKTFEYDLATYNPKVLATALKTIWPSPDGEVCKELDKIIDRENNYDDLSILAKDAEYIYKHIESSEIGKRRICVYLSRKNTDDFMCRIIFLKRFWWACGGQTL